MKKVKLVLCLLAASFLFAGCGESTKKKYCQKHDTFDENLCCVECGEFHIEDNGKGEPELPYNPNHYYLYGPYKLVYGKQYESDPWGWCIFELDESKLTSTTVEVPASYRDVPITFISGPAFQNCTTIEHLIFPEGLNTNVGGILMGCTSLKSITTAGYFDKYWFGDNIPSSLKEIKYIGEDVTLAGEFDQYPSIEKITLSKNTKNLNAINFVGFTNLQNVYYEGTVGDWCNNVAVEGYFDYLNAKINFKNSNNEYEELKNVVIPEGVTEIKENAFRGMKIESVVIPDSVTKINKAAFRDCGEIKSVVLGKNVNTIETDAFYCCFEIETVWYKGTYSSFNNIYVVNSHLQEVMNKPRYYYDEDPSLTEKLSGELWYYNENGEPKLWSEGLNVTNTVDGKTYKHLSTEVVVSDEYWAMLEEAKAQEMLETVLEPEVLVLYNNSANKVEYQEKLTEYYSNLFSVYTITFEDGKTKIKVNGQPAWPSEYVELNGSEIYEYNKVKYQIKDGKIYEQAAAEPEFLSVINVYEIVTE